MATNITEYLEYPDRVSPEAFKNVDTFGGMEQWTVEHFVNDIPYAEYVWQMIYSPEESEDQLDKFGPYSMDGIADEFISPYTKAFMFLDTMLQSGKDAEMFWQTSSTLALDAISKYCQVWFENPQRDVKEIFLEMIEELEEYLEGC